MSDDPEGAIRTLQDGLKPDRPHIFREADTLVSIHRQWNVLLIITENIYPMKLIFELAWTLLAERRYQESADMFMRITKLNTWYVFVLKPQGVF